VGARSETVERCLACEAVVSGATDSAGPCFFGDALYRAVRLRTCAVINLARHDIS
jgi:hypothetical protein